MTKDINSRWRDVDGLRVMTLGCPDNRRQVLVFMGFLACVEPFEVQRFALLCAEWGAQITVVDTPGFGHGGASLTTVERRGLRRGDFTVVARRMVRAAQDYHRPLRRGPVVIVGYSMGASLACAAAADPGLLRVSDMVLVEPVAMRRCSLLRLIGSVRSEGTVIDDYLTNNRGFPDAVLPAERRNDPLPHRSRRDLAHLGFGLSRGRIASDLLHANHIQRFVIEIAHGADSKLSRAGDVARLVTLCRRRGLHVLDVPVAGRHALWHSLPDAAALARATLTQ